MDGFTMGESFNIVSLAHGVFQFQGLSGGEQQSISLVIRSGFDSLVQRVMGLFALAEHQIWRLGWLTSFINKDTLLTQLSFCIMNFLKEIIFREVNVYYEILK
jgi:ATP-dependent Clp protease ATP-binding subunit ClpC